MRSESKQSPRGRLRGRPLCGAKTRAGGSCKVRAEPGKARCRFHGRQIDRPKDTSWSRSNCGGPAPTMALLSSATRGAPRIQERSGRGGAGRNVVTVDRSDG
jgi:hypothetical protein